ncbi:PREDICTED: malate dehydrogenase, cytoplasmic-like [Dufourea novaeangliae]|uniref:Malate dehydrogenase, cytoplasmic n=1 Tax=Dufourea novaeangliae TaxID=178035 RepID=A0A154PLD6_DUFNO|nr:PREDICTED: malate dehydrogenase, cytoplasmic-like [Dufourea novaeangliae]KZC12679.1 Malate dehydrogenase, cytoplasmic [Dufourea novaeangliae]
MDNVIVQESVVTHASRCKSDVLRVVVTDGSSDIALALIYRILSDQVFGSDQSVFISIYEFQDRAVFLESVAIELTLCSPNLLHGITYSDNASIAFKDANVVFCIGSAREYAFNEQEYKDLFFKEYVRVAKAYGEFIEEYANRDARIIVIGNTAATIISCYAKSIPRKNITTLALFNAQIAAAHISARANCHPGEIKNIILWGNNNTYNFPDCRYMYLTNGNPITDDLKVWLRNDLPTIMQSLLSRPRYLRSMAYSLAEHCKILWNGTPDNEWVCMGVLSDHSYDIPAGMFFSYPVFCKDRNYDIVQGLVDDKYVGRYILSISRLMTRDVAAALKLCGLNNF